MTRVLKRPMFRIGGPANEGITSGLRRPGYENAGSVQDVERRKAILRAGVGQQPDTSLSQFLIDFGLNVASAPPSGSIFSTAAASAKEPYQGYKATKARRGAYDQQIGLAAAQSTIEQRNKMAQILAQKPDPSTGLRNIFLEKAINDGYDLPEAERIADYQITIKSDLQNKVGRNRLGGILDFDVSDEKTMKKRMPKLREKTGQFFFDPYDGKIKELVNEGGKLFFREFNSVAEITFETPDDTATVVDPKFMGEPAFPPEYMGGA